MDPSSVAFSVVAIALVYVFLPVGVATFLHYRRPRRVRCPLAGTDATVEVDATGAALAELVGTRAIDARACSRWPGAWGCRQQCLDDERGEPSAARPTESDAGDVGTAVSGHTVLVPLDGTPVSEDVLPEVEAIARRTGARVRLLQIMTPPPMVTSGERVVAYADQETTRLELESSAYLKLLADRLPGIAVDGVVRFGEPVSEIVAEAESVGADMIVMATHDRTGVARLRWGSVTDAVTHATRIPVIRVAGEPVAA